MKNREIVFQGKEKQRIDIFLKKILQISRTRLQKLIKNGKIKVNQQVVEKNYFLKPKDKIEILAEKKPLDEKINFEIKLETVFENRDFLVINKPAGLTVHPLKSFKEKSLVNFILNLYPEIKEVGDPPAGGLRPGIVHRLDKEVSGLLIVARTKRALAHFKKEFQNHRVKKEYQALVYGWPVKEKGIITTPLMQGKSGKIILAKKVLLEKIKEAWTEYEIIKKFSNLSLLKIKTKTGRTHQIRIHLKSIGHPIVGDRQYSIKQFNNLTIKQLNRIFLHACYLGFYNLENKWQEFKIDLPEELKNYLNNLK